MQRTRASKLAAAVAAALVLATLPGCGGKPTGSTAGSTDTIQSTTTAQTTGTTATETGGGPPVTTTRSTTATTSGPAGATGTH